MIKCYSFTKKEHVNFANLKKFLRSIYPNYYPQSYTTTSHEINQKEGKLCHNQIDDGNEKFEPQTQKENVSMNNCINNLRDNVRDKEAFTAKIAKYETVNCRNVYVTKEKEKNARNKGLIKLDKTL